MIHDFARATRDPDVELIVFGWHNRNGHCQECGIPAAFLDSIGRKLCSVCAAQEAADGDTITRIEELD